VTCDRDREDDVRIRSYRKREAKRAHTIQIKRFRARVMRADHADTEGYDEPIPSTYGECLSRALGTLTQPCWYLRCRYNLLLDIDPRSGSYKVTWPDLTSGAYGDEYHALPAHTCALHEAAHGGLTVHELGLMLNLTRERVRQIETKALHALRGLSDLVRAVDDELDQRPGTRGMNGDTVYLAW